MNREDEYTVRLSSRDIVILICCALGALCAVFIAGVMVGKSSETAAPSVWTSAAIPEPSLAPPEAAKIALPEIPKLTKTTVTDQPSVPKKEEKKAATIAKTVAKAVSPPPSKPAPTVTLPAAPATKPPSSPIYTICVLSARHRENAEKYVSMLLKQGYKASVIRTQSTSGVVWYRAIIGEFIDRAAAERQLAEFKKKGPFKDAFIRAK